MESGDQQQESSAERDRHGEPDGEDDGRLSEARALAESQADRLQEGRTVSLFGAAVPVRVLIALGVFVLVFMLVWTALWGLAGGIGLALGWIPATLAGMLAVGLVGRSRAAGS